MSYFIIIRGPLGSGKTTISKKLALFLKAKYIGMDKILEKQGLDNISLKISCIPVKNFIKANKIILPAIKKMLKNGKIIIFDACFYHQKVIEHLIQNLSFPHYIFTLKAPLEICIRRDRERNKSYGENAATTVHSLVSQFDYGHIIDVAKNLENSLKDILLYLPKK